MNVQICIRHMSLPERVKRMIRELCGEVENRHGNIQNIDVKIADINGPYKTGIDKRCHLKVRGNERLMIDIEETDHDLDCAIDRAFRRLKQTLRRYSPMPGWQTCRQ